MSEAEQRLLFSQQFCRVVPYTVRGGFVAGAPLDSCLVQVTNAELVIVRAPRATIDRGLLSDVEVEAPPAPSATGSQTFVRMNGKHWVVDFGCVGVVEYRRAHGPLGRLGVLFRGRSLNRGRSAPLVRDFTAALLANGATDRRSGPAS